METNTLEYRILTWNCAADNEYFPGPSIGVKLNNLKGFLGEELWGKFATHLTKLSPCVWYNVNLGFIEQEYRKALIENRKLVLTNWDWLDDFKILDTPDKFWGKFRKILIPIPEECHHLPYYDDGLIYFRNIKLGFKRPTHSNGYMLLQSTNWNEPFEIDDISDARWLWFSSRVHRFDLSSPRNMRIQLEEMELLFAFLFNAGLFGLVKPVTGSFLDRMQIANENFKLYAERFPYRTNWKRKLKELGTGHLPQSFPEFEGELEDLRIKTEEELINISRKLKSNVHLYALSDNLYFTDGENAVVMLSGHLHNSLSCFGFNDKTTEESERFRLKIIALKSES